MTGGMNTGRWASAECDEPVSGGSDSHRYVSDSDGWRCQRMHIRPSPRVRTIIVRAWGERVVMAASIAGAPPPAPPCRCVVSTTGTVATGQPARRSRRELVITMTLEAAMAAPAIIGLSSPAAASGIAATL